MISFFWKLYLNGAVGTLYDVECGAVYCQQYTLDWIIDALSWIIAMFSPFTAVVQY